MNIWMILKRAMALYPNKIGVVDGDRSFTYAEIGARAHRLARFFQTRGIRPGARIAIMEFNSHVFLETYYAAAGSGTILTPLNHRLSSREIAFILKDSGAEWLMAASGFHATVAGAIKEKTSLKGIIWIGKQPQIKSSLPTYSYDEIMETDAGTLQPASTQDDETAHLYYTSGTTGVPKGVMLSHRNVCVHALCTIAELQLSDDDIWAHIAPMFHLADAWAVFALTWVGGRHIMVPSFDAERVLSIMNREGITLTNLIPTMLNMMVAHPKSRKYKYAGLRVILSGGAPIAPALVQKIMETFGCDYIQTYGMTETSPFLTMSILKEHLKTLSPAQQMMFKAKTGRPFMAVDLKVVDDAENPVAQDGEQVGEIVVRGDTITPGYWNRPDENEQAFFDGWLRTGDLATMDQEGYVNIVDRKKDMIITGGENVYSIEVENVLYTHPKVLEAAVFGVPDEKWGECVHAAVVLKSQETATANEIISFCRDHLAAFKSPKYIRFMTELPKTGSGKIDKKALPRS